MAGSNEFPQLVNVLRGETPIVGRGRIQSPSTRCLRREFPHFSRRSSAQVNGCRGETDTVEKMRRRIECDLFYIDNWSFLLDIKIILTTLFSKRAYANAVQSSSIENKDRMRSTRA